MPNKRTCSKCGECFPLTEEYYYKDKRARQGFRNECKSCHNIIYREIYRKNKDKFREQNRKYYLKNKESLQEREKERYYQNREQKIKYNRNYYYKNREKILHQKKEYINQDHVRIGRRKNGQTRYARKCKLDASFTTAQWMKCRDYFEEICCYCGTNTILHQDHFVSIAMGGEYTRNNMVPCCIRCNSSKGSRDFFDWYPRQSFYSKKREAKILRYLNYDLKTKTQQLALTI